MEIYDAELPSSKHSVVANKKLGFLIALWV
jgi:hypothetical protein